MKLKEIAGMIGLTLGMRRQGSKEPNQERGVIDRRLRPAFARMQENSRLLAILKPAIIESHTPDGVLIEELSNITNITEVRFTRRKLVQKDIP